MKPNLTVLPEAQLVLWPMLSSVPSQYVLYGGTAVALHLGHRESVDFDFFSAEPLDKNKLVEALPFFAKDAVGAARDEYIGLSCGIKRRGGEAAVFSRY